MIDALVLDCETNALDNPEPIEVALALLEGPPASFRVDTKFYQRYRPSKPITFGARAIHHISDAELEDCAPSSSFVLPGGIPYVIGHNVDFDWQAIGEPDVRRICTQALSRMLWPDLDSHRQIAVAYYLDCVPAETLRGSHSAAVDVMVNVEILRCIVTALAPRSWDELWEASEAARVPTVLSFGKHKGTAIRDVPRDYVAWLLKQPDLDPYLRKALGAR